MPEGEPTSPTLWNELPPEVQELYLKLGLDENTDPIVLEAVGWGLQADRGRLLKKVDGIDIRETQHHLGNALQDIIARNS